MTTLEQFLSRLSRPRALLIVVLIWAAIYLPVLGSLEIKGEEGRRILPAVAMLDTGDWIVPQVGGVPYFSKPPFINWLIAASFRLTGTRGEWAARAPSVLAVLALGLTAVWALARWLGVGGALLCAVFLLTNIGLMEKGRLAEIESVYLGLFGVALLLWLGNWRAAVEDSSRPAAPRFPWRTWTLPWFFLGLGLLTKGPLHLVYFYAVVVGVLLCTGRWRDLFNWAHLLGILLMLGLFAAWAVPYLREIDPDQATGKWYAQMAGRAEVSEKFKLGAWLLNGPRGLVNFLPWVFLLPLAWRLRPVERRVDLARESDLRWAQSQPGVALPVETRPPGTLLDGTVVRGLCWAMTLCFVVVSLAPGGIPRYTLPLIVPASVLLALAFSNPACVRRKQRTDFIFFTVPLLGFVLKWTVGKFQLTPRSVLPLVWERTVALCLGLTVLAAPVAAYLGGKAGLRWLIALLVVTAAVYLLRRLPVLRRFAELPAPPMPVPGYLPLALASGVVMALLTADYAVGAVHRLHRHESVRPEGAAIRRAVPAGQQVGVLRPGFLPFLFYVHSPIYLQTPDRLPDGVHYLLVRQDDLAAAEASLATQGLTRRILLRVNDKRMADSARATWLLLGLNRPGEPGL